MTRTTATLVAFAVLVSTVAAVGVAADERVEVTVSDVAVDPHPPEPDEEFAIRATIHNLDSSRDHYEIDRVELKASDDESTLDELDSIGPSDTVAPGQSKTVTLEGEIESAGVHQLHVHVYGTTDEGTPLRLQYPFEIRVDEEHPQLDLAIEDAVANAETPVEVALSNGIDDDLRNVELTLDGEDVSVRDDERVRSRLASGEDATFEYTAVAGESGERELTATLRYTAADGERRLVTERTVVSFDPLDDRVELDASTEPDGSAISVTVTNRGNTPIEGVLVTADAAAVSASRAVIERVEAQSSRTVRLNVSEIDADGRVEVPVVASYDVGTLEGEAETTAKIASNPGRIELTGVEIEREGDRLHVSGSASNVGLSEADSVIVSVVRTANVTPAQPNKEYFVGTVPASDFVSFDVYAQPTGAVEELTLEVAYLVDGERHTREVVVGYEPSREPSVDDDDGDVLVPAAIGGVVVLGVAAIMAVAWRNSRDGT